MKIGRLEDVPLRQLWPHEEKNFTPWLAKPENMKYLGDEIGLDFEMESIQTEVKLDRAFEVDILAESTSGKKVVIENFLGRTDHRHLGQCITYAAAVKASVIVWICSEIHDQHRQAVEFLNSVSSDDFNFFLIKLGAVRIGESDPAPILEIVESPNNWAKIVRQSSGGDKKSKLQLQQLDFFDDVRLYGEEHSTMVSSWRKPLPKHWYDISIGVGTSFLRLTVNSREQSVAVALVISSGDKAKNKALFREYFDKKDDVVAALGELDWRELPEKKESRIVKRAHFDFQDDSQRSEAIVWLVETADDFIRVFRSKT